MAPASSSLPPFRSYPHTNSISSRIEVDRIRRVEEEVQAGRKESEAFRLRAFTFFRFRTNCTQLLPRSSMRSVLGDYLGLLENPATEVSNQCSWARFMPDCRRDPSATFSLLTRSGGRKKCGKRLLDRAAFAAFGSARAASLRSLRREENHPAGDHS